MPLVPLYGHETLRLRLANAVRRNVLPASIAIHGPRGIGKQRLALWLGQLLLCEHPGDAPCGRCNQCRFSSQLTHPDLYWFFPRPRRESGTAGLDEVRQDIGEAIAERLEKHGLYARPDGREAIYVATVRALVQLAALTPTLARHKVFVIGDAERMVPQKETEQAANAFLKLLEEPPDDTTIILTTSEPGALLPTIRSRVIALRAAPLSAAEMRDFAANAAVREHLGADGTSDEALRLAAGAPGALLAMTAQRQAMDSARELIAAAGQGRSAWSKAALGIAAWGARGDFSDVLDALTLLLAEQQRAAATQQELSRAVAVNRAVEAVEKAKERAEGNANPQLLAARLAPVLASIATR